MKTPPAHHNGIPRYTWRSAPALAVILLGLAALAGCSGDQHANIFGYTSKPLFTSAFRTVHVGIFGNKTFRRELEYRLTEAIDKNIEARTPYKIQSDRAKADTVLTGEITEVDEAVLTRRADTNLPRETELVIKVDFAWKDAHTGRILVQRTGFVRSATELPQLGERVEDALQRAVEELAYGVVSQMEKDF